MAFLVQEFHVHRLATEWKEESDRIFFSSSTQKSFQIFEENPKKEEVMRKKKKRVKDLFIFGSDEREFDEEEGKRGPRDGEERRTKLEQDGESG